MTVILMHKKNFGVDQYNDVSNIAYNSATQTYTITYGSGNVTSYDGHNYTITILFT